MIPCARFDDLTPGNERSFALRGLQETVVARRIDEIIPALEKIGAATADGLWAGGYIGYEAAPAFDPALAVRIRTDDDPLGHLPLVWFGLFDRYQALDPFEPRVAHPAPYSVSTWTPDIGPERYSDAIREIRAAIAAGDTYQVNYTFRLRAAFSGEPYELYRDLVLAQRGAYAAYFDTGRHRIVSASPERFFRLDENRIVVRPMKGTIRRGRWPEEDAALADRLTSSEKERAENLMIVDLLRNDLGRIAEFGSVTVDALLDLERYETLWQLTSEVSARLAPEIGIVDVLRALFPSGSITGAPKPRTMEIISDLEGSPRGVYCGAIGLVAPTDDTARRASFSVAIRTVVVDVEEGVAEYGVGGGITWDSVSESEYEEARLKAQLLVERRPEFDLLETLRWEQPHGYWWRDEHLDRMEASAAYFGYEFDRARAEEALDAAVDGVAGPCPVRLTSNRDGECAAAPVMESLAPMEQEPDGGTPIEVAIVEDPVSSQNVFVFHKTTRRRVYDERRKTRPEVADVILVNERGEVTESTTANLAVRFGDQWWTPPLDSGCLAGVYRGVLLEKGLLRERVIAQHELAAAEEIALINSVRGWRRAQVVD